MLLFLASLLNLCSLNQFLLVLLFRHLLLLKEVLQLFELLEEHLFALSFLAILLRWGSGALRFDCSTLFGV